MDGETGAAKVSVEQWWGGSEMGIAAKAFLLVQTTQRSRERGGTLILRAKTEE